MPKKDGEENVNSQLVEPKLAGGVIREENLEDFSPEWCQRLLNDTSYDQESPHTRKVGKLRKSSQHSLIGRTLFTDRTLRAMRFLYKPRRRESSDQDRNRIGGELLVLISLGADMCSHTNTLHGGINTLLVDEIGGNLAFREVPEADSLMAANFNVNLLQPVKTPGIILGRAWIEKQPVRRKVWVKVRLEQEGQVCIEAENLYLKMNVKTNM